MLNLPMHSAHLWCLDLAREPQAVAILKDRHVDWLSEREQQRYRRLQLPKRREHYLLGKVFTRQVLSRYSGTAPEAWQFAENPYGKPFIAGDTGDHTAASGEAGEQASALYFNLSHSRERFVLVVSRIPATGVDVEYCARKRRVSRLASRYFTATECDWLLGLAPAAQQSAFYQLWTLKEAYMKARGLGQALALDAFGFDLSDPGHIGFSPDRNAARESGVPDSNWRCWRLADPLAAAGAPGGSEDSGGRAGDGDHYALALMLGLNSRLTAEPAMSLSIYRYDVAGNDEQLTPRILAASV